MYAKQRISLSTRLGSVSRPTIRNLALKIWSVPLFEKSVNLASRRKFRLQPPILTDRESAIVSALRRDGIVFERIENFLADDEFSKLRTEYERRLQAQLALSDDELRSTRRINKSKPYLIRVLAQNEYVVGDEPTFDRFVLDDSLTRIAASYLRLIPVLSTVDAWCVRPSESQEPQGSQAWHRDFNDRNIVRVFLYLDDVPEAAGPLQYIKGTQADGKLSSVLNSDKERNGVFYRYLSDAEVEEDAQCAANLVTATGSRGQIIICDTSGLHRGGRASEGLRKTLQLSFTSNYDVARRLPRVSAAWQSSSNPWLSDILALR